MGLSVSERVLVPGIGVVLFAAASWGLMSAVGGDTARMKAVALWASVFMTGFGYSVFWQDKLAIATGWTHAWMAVVASVAVFSLCLFRYPRNRATRSLGEDGRG
jgi:hypothetical protein